MTRILVNGTDVSGSAIWAETQFESRAAAEPGTATVSLNGSFNYLEGSVVEFWLDRRMWMGYAMQIEKTYLFPDSPQPKTVLHCVDLNILLDKLIVYNHSNPALYPDGGGTFKRSTAGPIVIPPNTLDIDYIRAMIKDTDLDKVKPTISLNLNEVGYLNTTGSDPTIQWTPPSAGINLRALLRDVSTNVNRSQPGSMVWYINPDGWLVYKGVEGTENQAPFAINDGSGSGVTAKNMSVTVDASHVKNNVLVFANKADQTLSSQAEYLYYAHYEMAESVQAYGLHQWAETANGWSQDTVIARAKKIVYQEGGPTVVARFQIYEQGLFPGQLITINSSHHVYTWFDTATKTVKSTSQLVLPIREVRTSFVTKDQPVFDVTCSIDTQDPWGLLLALRKSTSGFDVPSYQYVALAPGEKPLPAEWYTHVSEFPVKKTGLTYQTAYGYLAFSLQVWVEGVNQSIVDPFNPVDPAISTADGGFIENSPDTGVFTLGKAPPAGSRIFVRYMKTYDLA